MARILAMSSYVDEVDSTGPLQKYSHEFRESDKEQKMQSVNWEDFVEKGHRFFLFCRKNIKKTSQVICGVSVFFGTKRESFSTRFRSWTAYGYLSSTMIAPLC